MEQILLAYSFLKETVMLYCNTKAKVCSLQRDTLVPYLSNSAYVLLISIDLIKENGLTLKKARRDHARTITDADHTDNTAVLANTPTQAESLLHSLKQAAGSIGLHVNADKMKYMYIVHVQSRRRHLHYKWLFNQISRHDHVSR